MKWKYPSVGAGKKMVPAKENWMAKLAGKTGAAGAKLVEKSVKKR